MDIEEILYTFEDDYNPSSMVQGPRNMYAGGQLVQPNADGSRPGYSGLPDGITKTSAGNYKALASRSGNNLNITKKSLKEAKTVLAKFKKNNPVKKRTTETTNISGDRLKVLNKYAQDLHGLNYKDLGPGQVQEVYNTARNRDFEYRSSGQDPFPEEKKNKIIKFAKEKNIKLDFDEYPKYGVPKDIKGKRNTNYTKLVNFKNRGFEDFKKDLLSEADRIKVMDNFELPKGIKNWDFNNNKFGIPYTGNENISKRISNNLKEKKKYKVAADYSTPKGWMVSSMNRLYENETILKDGKRVLKEGIKKLTYEPIKNNKGIIVGFKDNTEAGGGKKYYSIKKYQDQFGDGSDWKGHGDFNRIDKFLKIAKGAQVDDPSKLLQKILDDKGVTKLMGDKSVLTLNDILSHERYFDKLSTTAPKKLIERQINLHHTKGVNPSFGNAAATKDLQLLSGVINQKVKGLEKFAKERKLTVDEIADLKKYGAKITDFDGKVVGGGYTDPTKQFAAIEKKALEYAKGDQFNVKTVASYLERLGCGKAAGGRILFAEGVPSLTKCAQKGVTKLENGLKSGFKNADDAVLARGILKSGRFLKDAVSLRGLFGPAALAFTAAAEAGIVGYDMLASGKSFKEAIGSSLFNYALGDKTKIDSDEEFIKRLKSTGNMNDQQIGKMLNFKSVIDDMNRGFDLNRKLQDLEGVQEIRDEKGKVIVKGKTGKILDNQTNQAIDSNFFPDNAFNLDAERDALRADIQDYNRTGTPRRVTDYLLSDKAKEGADASALANLYVKQDQLQNAGTAGILPLVDKGIEKDLIDTRFNLQQMNNPTEYNDFAKYFMSKPKQEQSMIMGLGYREGGIASLNVKK